MFEADIFGFLDGASPWWWVALALALGAIEVVTLTYVMLWLGLAALSTGVLSFLLPGMPGHSQVLAFAMLSLFYTVAGWYLVKRLHARGIDEDGPLNRRSAAVVGRQGKVTEPFRADVGWIEIDGVRWRARLADGAAAPKSGAFVKVLSSEGMTVVVGPAAVGPAA